MADITVKKVSEESFNSVALYLDYVMSITKEMGVPYFITMDGTKYFVTRVPNDKGLLYACAYEKEGKLRGFGMSVPEKNPNLVSITDGVSIYRDFSVLDTNPFVMKENIVNDNKEQVTIGQDPNGDTCMIYSQEDVERNMDCEIIYNIKGHENNLSAYMAYIDTKFPRSIVIGQDKKLFKVINHRVSETYRYSESQYLIPKLKIFGYEFADTRNPYELDEVLYNVRLNGFNSCIPKTMCEIMTHNNSVEKNMKILSKIYDENLMKIK